MLDCCWSRLRARTGLAFAGLTAPAFRTIPASRSSSARRETSSGDQPCGRVNLLRCSPRATCSSLGIDKEKLITQCFDRATGGSLWERVENRAHKQDVNLLNNPAAITPVTDGENVYVFFKDFGLISYDAAGKLRWKVPLGPFTNSMGLGASPIVAGDSIILVADQITVPTSPPSTAAMARSAGKSLARNRRVGALLCCIHRKFGTFDFDRGAGPIRCPSRRRRKAGIQPSRSQPRHGRQPGAGSRHHLRVRLWSGSWARSVPPALDKLDKNHDGQLTPDEYQDIPGDTSDHQMTAMFAGMGKYMGNGDGIITKDKWDAWGRHTGGPTGLLAVRLDGDASRDLWRYDKGFAGMIPSPLLYDGVLYVIRNGGILTAFNPATGEVLKSGRVPGALGGYSASPVAAEGQIFLVSEEGKVTVLRAGRDWEVLAVNDLGEGAFATPALSAGRIYVRTDDALYCFASKP